MRRDPEKSPGACAHRLPAPVRGARQASSKDMAASAGNRTAERTVGAPTIAAEMIAAAQRTPFAIRYL